MNSQRLRPEIPFPRYAYVTGRALHPRRNPAGHSFGQPETVPAALDPADWHASHEYQYGFDLLNHGYYWEAHEAWEGLWHAAGRSGTTAEFLAALIKLAAAGFKVRQGRPEGTRLHAANAARLLRGTRERAGADRYAGIDLPAAIAFAEGLAGTPPHGPLAQGPEPERVFALILKPADG